MTEASVLEWMKNHGEVMIEGDKRGWKCVWEIWDLKVFITDFGPTLLIAVQRVLRKAKDAMEEDDFQIHKKDVYERLVAEII